MAEKVEIQALYVEYKHLLFCLAYRLLGNVSDAEDIVHDVYARLREMDLHDENIKSLLCTMVTHRSLDLLKSARYNRESYIGTWLPDPVLLEQNSPLHLVMQREQLTFAVMYMLQAMNHTERVVFVLRESLQMKYSEIAAILHKTEEACRQVFSRAKKKINISCCIADTENADQKLIARSFILALQSGNIEALVELLSADVAYYADGGGIVKAAIKPIRTLSRVIMLFEALYKKMGLEGGEIAVRELNVNGEIGAMVLMDQKIISIIAVQTDQNRIKTIFNLLNPGKIENLSMNRIQ
ncbi:sigma-70 family RNA polymerase sigma factor [Peribacillus sp. SCS-155]|uniref:sigma-70 family RNA polymerase sigma factor n=1 Tax=Peribacillus sedimenti TaxID=3115297 RepID=UPI00390605EE